MPQYLLGTDNGCTMAKAALFTLDGREVAVASRKVELLAPRPGFCEMDMADTWSATVESIRQVLARSAVNPRDIAAVAPTGHGNGLYLVDGQGQPVHRAIASTDSRARAYTDRWRVDGIDKAVRPLTMQSVWPAQPNALLAWLRDHEPDVLARAAWVLMCKDYVRLRLTGEVRAELTDMSGTSLMNVGAGQYDDRVLRAFGIPEVRRMLPPLVRSHDLCGRISAQAARQTGLAEGTPVAGGCFDIDACGLASGMTDDTQLCMVAGTWGNNQYISRTPVVDEDVFMTSCYSIPGYYLMLEGSATSASNLEWLVTQFLGAEAEEARQRGSSVYDRCNDLVEGTRPDDPGIVFLPFLFGSNVNPDAKAALVGLNHWHTRGHVLRAIYEGVVFAHRRHVDRLLKFRPMPQRIRLTGGAARSAVWVRIFADCFGVPVEVPEGTELGALGAAIVGAVAVGLYPDFATAVRHMVRLARTQEPDASLKAVYDAKHQRYQQVIQSLDGVWGGSW
jgi:L-xylulokinase